MPFSNIDKPNKYFTAKTFTGTGASQSITGLEFSPDFVWLKSRSTVANHYLYDIIRGANNQLLSNATSAESTVADRMTAFNSDGFTVGSSSEVNGSGNTTVAWTWDANGTGVSNTNGTISSTVSANTTSGFSIVSYTGNGSSSATVGHGLGVAPKMIILKRRNASDAWYVMHKSLTSNNNVFLNLTDAQQSVSTYTAGLISTSPTSSVFSFVNGSTVNNVNASGATYIAYCFAEVKGFSKFGSFLGNGSADGRFVYTGFKPAFLMWKRSDSSSSWAIIDSTRDTYNVTTKYLIPNASDAEASTTFLDFVSNGFKLRTTSLNESGGTYIYMCFAENPFVSSKSIPTTAR
jgi:hypothetical protein